MNQSLVLDGLSIRPRFIEANIFDIRMNYDDEDYE